MAKALRKALDTLAFRREQYEKTKTRQERNSFNPNLSGGKHAVHRPGSMKKGPGRKRK